jgi:hypothetical protein
MTHQKIFNEVKNQYHAGALGGLAGFLLRSELHYSRQPDRCTLFRTVWMAALMLAAALQGVMPCNAFPQGVTRCTLPNGIGHKKHDKPPIEKHFFLLLLCITLDARPLPFLSLYRGLTETSREKQEEKNLRSAVRRHGVKKAHGSATNK